MKKIAQIYLQHLQLFASLALEGPSLSLTKGQCCFCHDSIKLHATWYFDPVARVVNFWNTLCGDDELSKDKGKKAKSLQVMPFSIQRTNLFLKHNTAAVFTGNTLFTRIALFSSEYLSHWRKKFYKEVETGSNTPGTSSKTNTGKQWKSLEIMEMLRFLPAG